MSEGSKFRDYRGVEGAVEDAVKGGETRFARGRWGGSNPKSPRPGVRDPGESRIGPDGEKTYGPPMTTPPPQRRRSEREREARPDPLKNR